MSKTVKIKLTVKDFKELVSWEELTLQFGNVRIGLSLKNTKFKTLKKLLFDMQLEKLAAMWG